MAARPCCENAMARPIWNGTLSFGLLNVPVSLMSGERRVDLHFRMLDSRNNARIRYERVNAETGAEVPWKDIVKAFEYDKGSYVVLKPEDIKSAAPETHESIDVEAFIELREEPGNFFWLILEVAVHEHDARAQRCVHSGRDGHVVAEIP